VLATEAGGTGELLGSLEGMLVPASEPREAARIGARLAELLAREHDPEALRAAVAPLSWENGLDALESCLDRAVSSPAESRRGTG
jgi:hypothetical protein